MLYFTVLHVFCQVIFITCGVLIYICWVDATIKVTGIGGWHGYFPGMEGKAWRHKTLHGVFTAGVREPRCEAACERPNRCVEVGQRALGH